MKINETETKEEIENVFTLEPNERLEQFNLNVENSLANKVKDAIDKDTKSYFKRKSTMIEHLKIVLNFFIEINDFIRKLEKNESYFLKLNQEEKKKIIQHVKIINYY